MRRLLKDPLAHFLAAGAALFVIGAAMKPAAPDEASILVDRAALLEFIQYRSKAFEPGVAAAILDGMDDEARAALIRDFVREEAMAREAQSLGLEANDYVIRQRMVQKVEFLAEAAASAATPTDEQVAEYYNDHQEQYLSPPSATMTHVFFSTEKRPAAAARIDAEKALAELAARHAGFNDAGAYGERFLFHKNYVERTDDYIRSQLGDEIVDAIFDETAPLNSWRGPFMSEYGVHLIYVAERNAARLPSLEEIADLVKSDLTEEMRQQAIDGAIDSIVAKYKIDDKLTDRR